MITAFTENINTYTRTETRNTLAILLDGRLHSRLQRKPAYVMRA